ncbi:MAG: YdiU family protein [Paracoccus sp. (in: a-proteobacteria)]|nr:YdiU family protein [Paracoccus sp. (in: a-proteobacteria)]
MIRFDNSYTRLPARAFARQYAGGSPAPALIAVNGPLAARLGIDADWLEGPDGVAMLAGNWVPEGADPIATAYAGHQFGNFVPQLGDGRALLLGEVIAPDGARFDLQLKGSGRTPFSRMGDGLAWLGPVLREYLVSEFMAAAGVPTTRALGAVRSGAAVQRETALPGAILARVAASHIRVGSFEYFAARGDVEMIHALYEMVRARHYPDAESPLELLEQVIARQAATIARWMALGFVHGVMNTDNMAISGETIDYGPCAFIDGFRRDMVFSSIDRHGRYAWAEQPHVAVWNLAQFASCLIPLMGDEARAIEEATRAVHAFPEIYRREYLARFGEKLGLTQPDPALIEDLLSLMERDRADFTRVFNGLATGRAGEAFTDRAGFAAWQARWQAAGPDPALMARANPLRIPRNHRIEEVIQASVAGDDTPFHRMLAALSAPYEARAEWDDLSDPPQPSQIVQRTFCGT